MTPESDENRQHALRDTGTSVGALVAGKYRVEKVIGVGGMGVVVRATHLDLDEKVALKFLSDKSLRRDKKVVARFLREAKAAVKIKSEHVVRVTDVGTLENGAPYIVMEYLEGSNLDAIIERGGQQPIAESVEFLLQACEAVAHAHAAGVVHRDLKPGNLFVTRRPDGTTCLKVFDFGISKLRPGVGGNTGNVSITQTSTVMGSPAYMSPEQWVSAKNADTRSDIWSLGAILYELLTGRAPFSGEGMPQICRSVMQDVPESISVLRPEVPAGLEGAVSKCLAKLPEERPQNVAELAVQLVSYGTKASRLSARRTIGILDTAGMLKTRPYLPGDSEGPPPEVLKTETVVIPPTETGADLDGFDIPSTDPVGDQELIGFDDPTVDAPEPSESSPGVESSPGADQSTAKVTRPQTSGLAATKPSGEFPRPEEVKQLQKLQGQVTAKFRTGSGQEDRAVGADELGSDDGAKTIALTRDRNDKQVGPETEADTEKVEAADPPRGPREKVLDVGATEPLDGAVAAVTVGEQPPLLGEVEGASDESKSTFLGTTTTIERGRSRGKWFAFGAAGLVIIAFVVGGTWIWGNDEPVEPGSDRADASGASTTKQVSATTTARGLETSQSTESTATAETSASATQTDSASALPSAEPPAASVTASKRPRPRPPPSRPRTTAPQPPATPSPPPPPVDPCAKDPGHPDCGKQTG